MILLNLDFRRGFSYFFNNELSIFEYQIQVHQRELLILRDMNPPASKERELIYF